MEGVFWLGPEVSISNTSGLAGIAYWINKHLGLKDDKAVSKQDWIVTEMKARIDALYTDGRTTVMGEDELEKLFKKLSKDDRCSLKGLKIKF